MTGFEIKTILKTTNRTIFEYENNNIHIMHVIILKLQKVYSEYIIHIYINRWQRIIGRIVLGF